MGFSRGFYRICLVVFALAAVSNVYARGARESGIAEADKLIAQKRYTEALDLLTTAARTMDDSFDAAQARMKAILRLTQTYNRLAGSLLDTAQDNPENLDEILKISARLHQIEEAARSENTRNVVGQIYISARFSRYGRELNKIMVEARDLLDKGDYIAALQKYQTGFTLYRDEFRRANVGGTMEAAIQQNLDTLIVHTNNLVRTAPLLRGIRNQLESMNIARAEAVENNPLPGIYAAAAPELENLIQIKKSTTEIRDYFLREGAALELAGKDKNAAAYPFVLAFLINGRDNQTIREGFLGTYDALWDIAQPAVEERLAAASGAVYGNAWPLIQSERYTDSMPLSETGRDISSALVALTHNYIDFTSTDNLQKTTIYNSQVPREKSRLYIHSESSAKVYNYFIDTAEAGLLYERLSADQNKIDAMAQWRAGQIGMEAALEIEARKRADVLAISNMLETDISGVRSAMSGLVPYANTVSVEDSRQILENAQEALAALAARLFAEELAGITRYYALCNAGLDIKRARAQRTVTSAVYLMDGFPKRSEAGEEYQALYPQEALNEVKGLKDSIARAINDADEILVDYDEEPPRIPRSRSFEAMRSETLSLKRRLTALNAEAAALLAAAEGNAEKAAALRLEGNHFITEARANVKRQEFDNARDLTAKAAERYNASLAIQESDDLRRYWDENLVPLNAEITRLEYEMVVGEVRELVTRASSVYFNGDYEASEELLIRAATRWSIVSTTPNPEISYWLSLARGALSLQSGRIIPETAPLYKPMSQLLTGARKNYEQGLVSVNEGRKNEGIRKLKQAKELLYEVRILFPINHDAGILDLRIDQLLDPENFERAFNTRFTTAVAETKRGSREAYADMQNLAEIRPDFPGMRRALYQAEIDIGLRQPPADTTAATRATELARRAQSMLDNPAQHAAALDLVNEALRINPNSTLAMSVKDRLQVAMSRQNVAVIDRTTEQEYIRAVSELQRGNTIIAMSIVQKLLQNPNNRNSVKINELLRRIEAML
ncbi:MAG: hypothetical protein LBD20_03065 [Spirochaetaceae bacterium]|jgi:hypothetical protein|nr:hypothetical protein [Spirochaetaceae bacterium]